MRRMLVLGVGNTLMRDDGIGPMLAEAFKPCREGLIVIPVETDFAFALSMVEPHDFVVLLDAELNGNKPGSVSEVDLCTAPKGAMYSLHEITLYELILQEYPKADCVLIGIEASKIEPGLGLSSELDAAFLTILNEVEERILALWEENRKCMTAF